MFIRLFSIKYKNITNIKALHLNPLLDGRFVNHVVVIWGSLTETIQHARDKTTRRTDIVPYEDSIPEDIARLITKEPGKELAGT